MKIHFPLMGMAVLAVLATSCKSDDDTEPAPSEVTSFAQMEVPSSFNYETDRRVDYSFSLDQPPSPGNYRIDVYDYFPRSQRGKLMSAMISAGEPLSGKLRLPASVDQLYVVTWAPSGNSFLTVLSISGNSVNHRFYPGKRQYKSGPSSPDCNSGCDQTQSHTGWWNANNSGQTYCVTGSYNGGGITIQNGASVRLCGSGSFNTVTIGAGTLEITGSANVTMNNLNVNTSRRNLVKVYEGATLTLTNWFTPSAAVENDGTIHTQAMGINAQGSLLNNGTFTVSGSDYTTIDGQLTNNGTFSVNGAMSVNGVGSIQNNCQLTVGGEFFLNGFLENSDFMKMSDKFTINGGGRLSLVDGSMTRTKDMWIDGEIIGKGNTSLIKVAEHSHANSSGQVSGNVEYCDEDGIENFSSNTLRNGAIAACDVHIPTSPCNPEGHGAPQVVDSDNDGIADKLDDYPNDASRAFDNFYPSEQSMATLAFEDLWPALGDYDFNDLVIDYRYQQVLNASNELVDLNGSFVTRAVGGSFSNGFGFQLDLPSSSITSVNGTSITESVVNISGNGTESGQSKATVIVYDNAQEVLPNAGGSFVNTISTGPHVQPDTLNVSLAFSGSVGLEQLGDAPYNPFIFIDQDRGRELHLPGAQPTDLADANFFGQSHDDTDPNGSRTYKSARNLPWAINVVGGFQYPEENQDIVKVYHLFSDWAQSGGVGKTDWYEDRPGYIDNSRLYQQQ